MNQPVPDIMVKVDMTNPGQFFACCGLIELADPSGLVRLATNVVAKGL
ncbi:MAG: hypothetical protein ACQESR_23920 [Planctomycetota bacterium]